jgi:hypothetical protein
VHRYTKFCTVAPSHPWPPHPKGISSLSLRLSSRHGSRASMCVVMLRSVVSAAKPTVLLGINSASDLSGHASQCPERWRHLALHKFRHPHHFPTCMGSDRELPQSGLLWIDPDMPSFSVPEIRWSDADNFLCLTFSRHIQHVLLERSGAIPRGSHIVMQIIIGNMQELRKNTELPGEEPDKSRYPD